ncbi:MAG: T9SS type A sorting domain-containing protein [bacterium]|nr:T9SS type A sorting domain-containing protein [bacterium]
MFKKIVFCLGVLLMPMLVSAENYIPPVIWKLNTCDNLGKDFFLPGANGTLHGWMADRTQYFGRGDWLDLTNEYIYGKPAVIDVGGDGVYDHIVIATCDNSGKYKLHTYTSDAIEDGLLGSINSDIYLLDLYSSPTFGYINRNSDGTGGELILVLTEKGGGIETWNLTTSGSGVYLPSAPTSFALPSPVFYDLDGDKSDELIVAAGGGTGVGNIYIWKWNNTTPAWEYSETITPVPNPNAGIGCTPVVCDVDGYGDPEIIACYYDGSVYCWGKTGSGYNIPSSNKKNVIPIAEETFYPVSASGNKRANAKQFFSDATKKQVMLNTTQNYGYPIEISTVSNNTKDRNSIEKALFVTTPKKSAISLAKGKVAQKLAKQDYMVTTNPTFEKRWSISGLPMAKCFPSSPVVGNFYNTSTSEHLGLEVAVLSSSNQIYILSVANGDTIRSFPISNVTATGLAVREDLPPCLRTSLYYGDKGSHFVELCFNNDEITKTECGQFAHYRQPIIEAFEISSDVINDFTPIGISWTINYQPWTVTSAEVKVFDKDGYFKQVVTSPQSWAGNGLADGDYYLVLEVTTPFGDCVKEAKKVTVNHMGNVSQYATAYNNQRKLIDAGSGVMHLVWADETGVLYAKSMDAGESWTDGYNLAPNGDYVSNYAPTIAIDKNGGINVCWIEQVAGSTGWNHKIISYRRKLGENWCGAYGLGAICVPPTDSLTPPSMAIGQDNKARVAVQHYEPSNTTSDNVTLRVCIIDGLDANNSDNITMDMLPDVDLWTLSGNISQFPSIGVSGNVTHICWERNGTIYYRFLCGTAWSIPTQISTGVSNKHPCLEVVDGSNTYALLGIVYEGEHGEIYYKKGNFYWPVSDFPIHSKNVRHSKPYDTWAANITTIYDNNPGEYPVVVGGTQILWRDVSTNSYIFHKYLNEHNVWSDVASIGNSKDAFPQIAFNATSSVLAEMYSHYRNNIALSYVYTEQDGSSYKLVFGAKTVLHLSPIVEGTLEGGINVTTDVDVYGDIIVKQDSTLTIEPGVKLNFVPFQDGESSGTDLERSELIVNGTLIANMATFTCDSLQDSLDNWYVQNWHGIVVKEGGSAQLRGCEISNAKYGVYTDGSLFATNTRITKDSIGVYVNSNASNVVLGNIRDGIKGNDGMNSIYNNILWNLYNNDTEDSVIAQANYWGDPLKIHGLVRYDPPGYDLQKADWIISTNGTIYGIYWNVGTFKINSGITAKVATKAVNTTGWILISADSMDIQGTFSADSAGYLAGEGPGAGTQGASSYGAGGAGFGGRGGHGGSNLQGDTSKYGGYVYGSPEEPFEIGSGGGNSDVTLWGKGGAGGGIIDLICLGGLNVASTGTIRSNGKDGTGSDGKAAGGGSGGTVVIETNRLSGTGTISSKGGNGATGSSADGGGGAGGRIHILYNKSSFAGRVDVSGGDGPDNAIDGQPGTALVKQTGDSVRLVLSPVNTATNTDDKAGFIKGVEFTDKWIRLTSGDTIISNIELKATDSIIVNSASYLLANDKGYCHNQGTGYGHTGSTSHGGGGAGYGNSGGYGNYHTQGGTGDSGITYGDTLAPDSLGSGGGDWGTTNGYRWGGGSGGGMVKLICYDGIGQILLNGTISANGSNGISKTSYAAGGGSGGSVLIYAKEFAGSGSINAKGGNGGAISGCYGGGGAGGRVRIYRDNTTFPSGNISVSGGTAGGSGATAGNTGTVNQAPVPSGGAPQGQQMAVPIVFKLYQNYPNPFVNKTTIKYSIPRTSFVSLKLYDVTGRCVKTLVSGEKIPGYYNETIESKNYSTGVYFAKFKAGDYRETRKLVLMK